MKISRCLFLCLILLSAVSVFAQSDTEKGMDFYRNGNYDEAIAIFDNVVKSDKKNRQAWMYLGASLAKKGKEKEAVKAFRKADFISIKSKKDSISDTSNGFKIIKKTYPSYSTIARDNQTQGNIKLAVEFGEDGNIKLIIPLNTLPDGLTENSIYAARQIKFNPALKDGKPISTFKIIEYHFSIF